MTLLTLALVVGVLFATGTYLILHRRAIRLILGLGLLTHGVNLLLFSSGGFGRGLPPIILDKKAFDGNIAAFVDPLPQALILTAIVISFAVTAFTVILVNRRHSLALNTGSDPTELPSIKAIDPFASIEHHVGGMDDDPEDYEWLEFSLADELRRRRAKVEAQKVAEAAAQAESNVGADKPQDGKHPNMQNDEVSDDDHMHSQDGDLLTSEAFVSEHPDTGQATEQELTGLDDSEPSERNGEDHSSNHSDDLSDNHSDTSGGEQT